MVRGLPARREKLCNHETYPMADPRRAVVITTAPTVTESILHIHFNTLESYHGCKLISRIPVLTYVEANTDGNHLLVSLVGKHSSH